MPLSFDDLQPARARIVAAYDPALLSSFGHRLADLLAQNLAHAERSEGAVLPWTEPAAGVEAAAAELRSAAAAHGIPGLTSRFTELARLTLTRGLNLHDPRYLGHQVPAPVPLAGLFDAIGSVTNQVMAIYEMGPWATAVEQALVNVLGQAIGWPAESFSGAVTHGGSLANLTALLTARNVAIGDIWEQGIAQGSARPVILAHADAHYSVARAAGILGLGSRQIVPVGLDSRGRMDPAALEQALTLAEGAGRPIVAVVACACATPIGAFDTIPDIADICEAHGVWLHVDAAHGGAAILSERHRHLLAGLDRADSVVLDAHKMLFVPGLCAFVFYRDRAHRFEAFRQDAPYLFDPAAPGLAEYDSGMKTVECTKRAAALGLWGVWSIFGRQLFADLVDVTFSLGQALYQKLLSADDFVPLHEPQCNIVVFRHVPEELRSASPEQLGSFQLELRRRVIESGEFYIVPSKHGGVGALRVTLINPLTTPAHLDGLLDSLRRHGRAILREW